MYDLRRPCDADYQCQHRVCHACERTLRSDNQRKDEHPGTVAGNIRDRLCNRCKIEGHPSIHDLPQPEPEPESEVLPDERHILLSDEEMLHIMAEHPTAFTWHAERRKRLRLGEYS